MTSAPFKKLLLPLLFAAGSLVLLLVVTPAGGSLLGSVFNGGGLTQGVDDARTEIANTGIRDETDIVFVIGVILKFILFFAGIAAVVAIIIAGFLLILGFGSDASLQRAKKILIWAPVGLLVIILAFPLVNFVIDLATTP